MERKLMTLKTEASYTDVLPVSKKKYYIASNCYAMFNFDLNLLPMKLNLPMVYPPLPWKSKVSVPLRLSDLEGGYLSGVNVDIINRFRLLTSRDYNHFYIKWNSPNGVCDVLNILQSEVFEINTNVLLFILNNRDLLEEVGLLLPKNLLKVNLQEASDLLRSCYFNDQVVKDVCSCNVLLN